MNPGFIPFTEEGSRIALEESEFAPVVLPETTAPSLKFPPEKALADLGDALRIGMDDDALAAIIAKASGAVRTPSQPCPLPLRDLTTPRLDPSTAGSTRTPTLVVTRVGDVVEKVTVECPCGERISLDCVY